MTARTARQRGSTDPKDATQVRAAIYTRVSTDERLGQDFNSLDAQREAAEAYIASQKHEGWTCLPERYDDGGFSGATMDRPALKRLLADVEAGKVDCIVFYRLDRLSRYLPDFVRIMEVLDAHHCAIVSITEQFSTSTPSGRLHLNMLMSFAQHEREIISQRTADKMGASRRRGKWTGGPLILGYNVDPAGGRLVVNETEAADVRTIFDVYLEKESLLDTARELNRRGIRTKGWTTRKGTERNGHAWDKTRVGSLLQNFLYTGRVNYKGTVYPGEHPAIVDPDVWDRVQRLLRRNGKSGGRATRNRHGALLQGLLRCAPCDSAMTPTYTQRGRRRYRYYVCSVGQRRGRDVCPTGSLPAGEIERFVVERIRGIGTDPDLVAEVLKKTRAGARERADGLASERRQAERGLKRWHGEVKKLVGSLPRSNGKQATATARLAELNDRIATAELRLAEIREEVSGLDRDRVEESDLARALERFDPLWETLSPREQSRVIHLLVERVAFDAGEETVSVTFRPGGIKTLAQGGAAG